MVGLRVAEPFLRDILLASGCAEISVLKKTIIFFLATSMPRFWNEGPVTEPPFEPPPLSALPLPAPPLSAAGQAVRMATITNVARTTGFFILSLFIKNKLL